MPHAETADGARLAITTEGHGPDILLVSGLGGTAAFWSPVLPGLAPSFRVTRFDQRGIGASSRGTAACSIDQLARDCLTVMDAAGIADAVLVGHSTGGAIGQTLAHIAPGRLRGLVLSATWLRPSRYMGALFAARRRILELDPRIYAATGAVLGYAPAWLEANWDVYEAAIARPPASDAARRIVSERIDALLAFDGSAWISSLACPALVLGAADDVIVPAFLQEELAAALPGRPQAITYPDGGHFFPVTRADQFARDVAVFARGLA
ncbi:alpha/beta fold hydrolase [Enterovirga aerilata]|uniref:Alpha/beta fold hydrolase n=1 Tax=Enterovirga aerilata TaxID=2730920 RepID=A0A849IBA1_9HYPH|nr:alpha/beta hydrolase [Enterovirga sp. DB1703]NNM74561.1 alpha/beta fold hydrolase [Enterovirga sp. DB1703]